MAPYPVKKASSCFVVVGFALSLLLANNRWAIEALETHRKPKVSRPLAGPFQNVFPKSSSLGMAEGESETAPVPLQTQPVKSEAVQAAVKDFADGKITKEQLESIVKAADEGISRQVQKEKSAAELKKQEEINKLAVAAGVGGAVFGVLPGIFVLASSGLGLLGVPIGMAVVSIAAYSGAKQEDKLGDIVRSTVGTPTQDFFQSIQDSIEDSKKAAKKKVDDTINEIISTPGKIVNSIKVKIDTTVTNIVETPGRIADATKKQVDKTVAEVTALPEKTATAIKTTVEKQVDATQKTIQKTTDELVAIPTNIAKSVEKTVDSVEKNLSDMSEKVKGSLSQVSTPTPSKPAAFVPKVPPAAPKATATESAPVTASSPPKPQISQPAASSQKDPLKLDALFGTSSAKAPTPTPKVATPVSKTEPAALKKTETPFSFETVFGQLGAKASPPVSKPVPTPPKKVEGLNEVALASLFGKSGNQKPSSSTMTAKPAPAAVQTKDKVDTPAIALNEMSLGAMFGKNSKNEPNLTVKVPPVPAKKVPVAVSKQATSTFPFGDLFKVQDSAPRVGEASELKSQASSQSSKKLSATPPPRLAATVPKKVTKTPETKPPSASLPQKQPSPIFDLFGSSPQSQSKPQISQPKVTPAKAQTQVEPSKLKAEQKVKASSTFGDFGSFFSAPSKPASEPKAMAAPPSVPLKQKAPAPLFDFFGSAPQTQPKAQSPPPKPQVTKPLTASKPAVQKTAQPVAPAVKSVSSSTSVLGGFGSMFGGAPKTASEPKVETLKKEVSKAVSPAQTSVKSAPPASPFPVFFGASAKPEPAKSSSPLKTVAPKSPAPVPPKPVPVPAQKKQPQAPQTIKGSASDSGVGVFFTGSAEKALRQAIRNDEAFEALDALTLRYVNGALKPVEFYALGCRLLGKSKFFDVCLDIVGALPAGSVQKSELFKIYQTY